MKKLISIILVMAMAIAVAMPIFADDFTFTAEANGKLTDYGNGVPGSLPAVPVKYGVANGYTIEIPDFITFTDKDNYAYGTIKGSNILLKTGQTLTVTVESTNSWYMLETEQPSVKLAYTMALNGHYTDGGKLVTNTAPDNVVFEALPMAAGLTKTETLYCTRESTNQAGVYKDTLTFTCQIVGP